MSKIIQKIENLKDIRRNLWISVIALIGVLSGIIFSAKSFVFTWLLIPKTLIFLTGVLITVFFVGEVISCNKEINNLINKIMED